MRQREGGDVPGDVGPQARRLGTGGRRRRAVDEARERAEPGHAGAVVEAVGAPARLVAVAEGVAGRADALAVAIAAGAAGAARVGPGAAGRIGGAVEFGQQGAGGMWRQGAEGGAVTLDDDGLAERGLAAPARPGGRTLVVACGALAREILALRALNGWTELDLQCLPAKLHLWPRRIPDAVEAAVVAARPRYGRVLVAYADCGTGGLLAARCAALGVEMIAGPHCYAFFDGLEAFAARAEDEMRAFYLTDFLVRQFDAFVWRPMGLDRHPELRGQIFAGYERLIYLAQTEDPALDAEAARCAARLGLAFERRFTGYGELRAALAAGA